MYKIFLIILSLNLYLSADVMGQISDEKDGLPLIGASVYLEGNMNLESPWGASTDANGQYFIPNVPINNYKIIVKYIGYETFSKEINVDNIKRIENIMMTPSSLKAEETEVIGTAQKKDKLTGSPATKEVITSAQIEIQSSANLGSYLKGLKGVDYTASGMDSYSISVRGFNSSFSSRLLTLTDGRVANIPALRVVSYNTIPQSQDDIEKMEVILGPTTALYGANAHSGVVNIVSKSPASSEGFNLHFSGSNDARDLRKINGRFAKKINDHISFKLSASYLHAYEWEFISQDEWKNHQFAWIGSPDRTVDKKDNNPWNASFTLDNSETSDWETIKLILQNPVYGWNIANYWQDSNGDGIYQENEWIGPDDQQSSWDSKVKYTMIDGEMIIIGNGEANHGDLDGDGVAGEDWANGFDDDGDGLIDEDYFEADGIDNDGDGLIDENIDDEYDLSYDAADNNGNGQIDEIWEYDHDGDGTSNWGSAMDSELKIIIFDGRRDSLINGQVNPWYTLDGSPSTDTHIRGDYIWDEDKFTILFDTFTQDYGNDGMPGDLHIDASGNGTFDAGEPPLFNGFNDFGLDGINYTFDEGEGDGVWQPGDSWVDSNNNGIVDSPTIDGYQLGNQSNYNDVWPLANGIFDNGETIIGDFGQDGIPNTNDPGEGDGILEPMDMNELDGNYDTGDGCFGCTGDITDEQFQTINDTNGDGISDFPDFEIDNRKVEARIDIDGVPFLGLDDLNLTFQSGYSWSKSQIVTGVGRYIVDGWEYTFNQFKANYNNWFFQTYVNRSFSGNTRGYLRGDRIQDLSQNRAYQLQNNFNLKPFDTKVIWGIDYFKTQPVTNGTILNDGPNGRDEDGDGEIDEFDEFDKVDANEFGVYFQTSSKLSKSYGEWTDKWELITAARLDHHDQLEEENGLELFGKKWQFGPKIGLMYNPNPKHSFRLTYGKAFNTPTTTSLFTNYYVQDYNIFNVYLRGNKDGTNYVRVDENTDISQPVYYDSNGEANYYGNYNFGENYIERIQDMPYFYLYDTFQGVPSDWIPLDTTNFLVYVPEPNGDGYIIKPDDLKEGERYVADIPSIKSEKINSFELGYKTMIANMIISVDYYINHYSDFFSPATYITPTVVYRYNSDGSEATTDDFTFAGFIPGNQNNSNPPYSTGWNGIDDDGDWDVWASAFGWDQDDKNGDGDPRDPGEWGFVDLETGQTYTPAQLGFNGQGLPWIYANAGDNQFGINYDLLDKVGIDEWSPQEGMGEYECDSYPCSSESVQGRATSPPEIILGVLNYGNVWTQGIDMAFTQIFSEKLFMNGNFSWYNTTNFYNELTKRNDPINAPKFKWNINLTMDHKIGMFSAGYRHVDKFVWQDGIWGGSIGPYDLIDVHYKYKIHKNLSASISCLNIFNHVHREIVGGAKMGRQIVMRFSTNF